MAARQMNVHIRQEHIDFADKRWDGANPFRCALALALLEKEHTDWVVAPDYCNPLLRPDERWGHSAESSKFLDDYDGENGAVEVKPQTITLIKLPPVKKKSSPRKKKESVGV